MADRGVFKFRPWGQGRSRGRGRGRGRGRVRGRCQYLPFEHKHKFGQSSQEQIASYSPQGDMKQNTQIYAERPNFFTQVEMGKAQLTCSPEDTLSPGSSSSSKRSCTEMEENEEAKGKQFVKRRCKKVLSANFPRDGDGISGEAPTPNSKGQTLVEQNVGIVESENWDEILNKEDRAREGSSEDGLKMVQDIYNSSGSNEAESVNNTRKHDVNARPPKTDGGTAAKDKVLTSGKDCKDMEVDCLSNAVTENCTCTSDEDPSRSRKAKQRFGVSTASGITSFSSPTAGSKVRPFVSGRSKSDSWISGVQSISLKKKEKAKRRQRSSTVMDWQGSSDEELGVNEKATTPKGSRAKVWRSRQKCFDLAVKKLSAPKDTKDTDETDVQNHPEQEEKFKSDGMKTAMGPRKLKDTECDSEVCDADIESSQVEDGGDSHSDDEYWDNVVKKLSADGVDCEDVPCTQSKINQIQVERAANLPKYLPGIGCPNQPVQNRMDSPLQFRPGFRSTPPCPYPFFPGAYSCESPVNYQYGTIPPPLSSPPPSTMWPMMDNPYYCGESTMYQGYPQTTPVYQMHYPQQYSQDMSPFVGEAEHYDFTSNVAAEDHAYGHADVLSPSDVVQATREGMSNTDDTSVPGNIEFSYEAVNSGTSSAYQEPSFSPGQERPLPQLFIPRQVMTSSTGKDKGRAKGNNIMTNRTTPFLGKPLDLEPFESPNVLPSTEDSIPQTYETPLEEATGNHFASPYSGDGNVGENLKQTWYEYADVASDSVGSIQRKNRIWGKNLKQVRNLSSEPAQQVVPPVPALSIPVNAQKGNPPSYATVVASNQRNSMSGVGNREKTLSSAHMYEERSVSALSMSSSQGIWGSRNASFESASPVKSDISMNSPFWKSTPSPVTTSYGQNFRRWSVGSQGWNTYGVTSMARPVSAPPRQKTFSEIVQQRSRRLTLEDEVRGETVPKVPSWRSSSESEEILEVHYPASDVDYIDSHCHIDLLFQRHNHQGTFAKFALTNKFPENFAGCVAIFCYPINFYSTYTLAQDLLKEANIWGSFGCHPHQVKHYDGVMEERIKEWMKHPKTVALGEIGLDYSNRPIEVTSDHELQKMIFRRQLQLALDVQKPLVIHCRDAEKDTLSIMSEMVPRNHKIHRHCFTGPPEDAITFLRAFPNSFIGLTALVTFSTASATHQTARAIPLNRLLLETDTPYFVPRKVRGTKWSHPGMAIHVAERIAQLRGIPLDEVLTAVRSNTMAMYGI